jgi:hypothetical protein
MVFCLLLAQMSDVLFSLDAKSTKKIKAAEKTPKNAFMHLPKMKSKAGLNNSIGRICALSCFKQPSIIFGLTMRSSFFPTPFFLRPGLA